MSCGRPAAPLSFFLDDVLTLISSGFSMYRAFADALLHVLQVVLRPSVWYLSLWKFSESLPFGIMHPRHRCNGITQLLSFGTAREHHLDHALTDRVRGWEEPSRVEFLAHGPE